MDIVNYLNNTIKFIPFIIVLCFVLYSIFATDVKSIIFLTGLLITTFITKIMLPFKGESKQRTKTESKITAEMKTNTEIHKGNYDNNNGTNITSVINGITSTIQANPLGASVAAIIGAISSGKNEKKGGKKVVGGGGGEDCELLFLDRDEDSGGGKPISQIPLCLVTMWFLLSYILTIIVNENIWSGNEGLVILLILISLGYTSWFNFISDCTENFLGEGEDGDYKKVIFAPIVIGGLGGFLWALYISATNVAELKYFVGITPDERCSRPRRALYKCEFK